MNIKINALALLIIAAASQSIAQPGEKELRKHAEKIEKSRTKKSVEVSLDTLFYEGLPYCIFEEGKKVLGNALNITVKDLEGTERMWCKFATGQELNRPDITSAYEITFVATGNKALYSNVIGNSLEKEIVKHNLFANGTFNAASENRFISYNPYKTGFMSQPVAPNNAATPPQVQRNRNAMIMIMGEEIKQDNKTIGRIKKSTSTNGGKMFQVAEIYSPDGILIARAETAHMQHNWLIVTAKDNKTHQINSSIGKDDSDLADYLIKQLYL